MTTIIHSWAKVLAAVALIATITGFILLWNWLAYGGIAVLAVALLVSGSKRLLHRQRLFHAHTSSRITDSERERQELATRAAIALDMGNRSHDA